MKLCFFKTNIYPLLTGEDHGFGGAELDAYHISKALSKDNNFKVTILTLTKKIDKPTHFGRILVAPVKPYEYSQKRRGRWLRYFFSLIRASLKTNPDIFFIKGASLEAAILFFVGRLTRKKIVFRTQHIWETDRKNLFNQVFQKGRFSSFLFIFALKRFDLVIAQTEEQKKLLKQNLGVKAVRIYNLHHIPPKLPLAGRRYILWIGRVVAYKRPEAFLDIAQALPHEQFLMVGSKDENCLELFAEIEKQAQRISNLSFIPGVPRSKIESYFKKAKIVVISSESEGLSNVFIEACKLAVPVVSLEVDPDGLIEKFKLGRVAGGSLKKLKQDIQDMVRDKKALRTSAERGYALAKKDFNIKTGIGAYKKLFVNLLS